MAPEQLAEAERLIRSGADLDAVCAAVGVERRTLEREWRRVHGTTPGRWRRERMPREAAPSPVIFRLPRAVRADLDALAAEDGVEPNAWARTAVERAIALRQKK